MDEPLAFAPVHTLLASRDSSDWAFCWGKSEKSDPDFFKFYPQYIAALVKKIKASGAKRIFIIHQDRAFFLAGFLAALYAGVPVILPPSGAMGTLQDLLEPEDGLLTDQEILFQITPLVISMTEIENETTLAIKFDHLDPSKACVIFYTSGSTGTPKAVEKTLTQLEEEILVLEEMWGVKDKRSAFFSTVSHHHIYGLLFSLLWPVCAGYSLRRQTFSAWEDLLGQCVEGAYVISSPSYLGRFPSFMEKRGELDIRYVFSSAGLLSFAAAQTTQEFLGKCPIEVYGSTETGGIGYRQQLGSVETWTKFKNVELTIGEEKRLCVKSPYLPYGMVYQIEDLAFLQNDQQFRLLGRMDRIIKVEGKRICLFELEERLRNLEFIEDTAVLPLESLNRDELGAILVLSDQGKERLLAIGKATFVREIRKSLSLYFESVVLPRKWRFVSELPQNGQGKRPYELMRRYFGEIG